MTTCVVVGAIVVSCVADPATRPSPAEAAQVLARLDTITNFTGRFFCTDCDGPHAFILRQSATDGPFGPFPALSPNRPLSADSGAIYGLPPYGLPPPYYGAWPPFVLVDSIREVPVPSPSLQPRAIVNPPMAAGVRRRGYEGR